MKSIVYDYDAINNRLKPKPADAPQQQVVVCPKCGCTIWCGYDCKNRPWMKKSYHEIVGK